MGIWGGAAAPPPLAGSAHAPPAGMAREKDLLVQCSLAQGVWERRVEQGALIFGQGKAAVCGKMFGRGVRELV